MPAFPRKTVALKAEEQTALHWFIRNIVWFGVGVGVVLRLYRWVVLALLAPRGFERPLLELGVGAALICTLSAVHLANFTLRRWVWRAPALGTFIALGESATSLVLTLVHQERLGHGAASIADWPTTVVRILETRVLVVSLFALVLAGVVAALRTKVDTWSDEGSEDPDPAAS